MRRSTLLARAAAVAAILTASLPFAVSAAPPQNPQKPAAAADEEAGARPAPARRAGEGQGPFRKLVIRGATLIDGSGAPPHGPVDIVIENNRIASIKPAGTPGLPLAANRAPHDADHEIDATGQYVLPGFISMHGHGSGADKAPSLEYAYKLWLAHGITTVRTVPLTSHALAVSEKARSSRNEIVAPRIFNYQTLGAGWSEGPVNSPEKARAWVRWAARNNIDGIKFFNGPDETPEVMAAAIDEARKNRMGTVAHLSQMGVARTNALQAARMGLGTITHFYGHFEGLLKNSQIQDFRPDYNYYNEQDRFADVTDLSIQSVEPGTPEWKAYLEALKETGVNLDPTFAIYSASRDLMRARNADWHATYTMPQMWGFFQSTRDNHGSYFYDWTTSNEVRWRRFYQKYMRLVNDYKNMGGSVTTGSDEGFIYQIWGFGYVQELEMLQEAGFTPLEVVRAATMNGARVLYAPRGEAAPMGVVRSGMLADLIITPENPLANFKTLFGTGHMRLNAETNKQERVGGIKWTIKDGIVYDAAQLLRDVKALVDAEKKAVGAAAQ